MKKRLIAAVIALSISVSVIVGSVGAADLSETHCCKSYTSLLEEPLDWLKSCFDSYINSLVKSISDGSGYTTSLLSFGDQPILM